MINRKYKIMQQEKVKSNKHKKVKLTNKRQEVYNWMKL